MDTTKNTKRTDVSRDVSTKGKDTNPDPITGAPGSHPVGTGIGAVAGGAAGGVAGGAIAGAATGAALTGPAAPIGAVVGTVIGAVAGGYAGKGIAEKIDPTAEDAYWRENYVSREYYAGKDYDYDRDYKPAYQLGWETSVKNPKASYGEAESEIGKHWESKRGSSKLSWERAKFATRDAWERIRNAGSSDRTLKEGQSAAVPVIKEDLQVGKREVESGGVRIQSTMKERPVQEQVTLREEHAKVERRNVDRPASAADLSAFKEGTIEVTEKREVPVVSKEARVVEEVVVGKEAKSRTETVRDTVHETDVKVEHLAADQSSRQQPHRGT